MDNPLQRKVIRGTVSKHNSFHFRKAEVRASRHSHRLTDVTTLMPPFLPRLFSAARATGSVGGWGKVARMRGCNFLLKSES